MTATTQKRLDFEWGLVERIDEALTGCPGVSDELLRHTWCVVARLHRDSPRPERGCFARAATIAEYVAAKMKTRRPILKQVQRALAWLASEGLIFCRRRPSDEGAGSQYWRFVDFAGCREWLASEERPVATNVPLTPTDHFPISTPTTSPDSTDHFPISTPTTSPDSTDHFPIAMGNPYRNDSYDSKDSHSPQVTSSPTALANPETFDTPEGWVGVVSSMRERDVQLPNKIVATLAARGIRPEFVAWRLSRSRSEGALLRSGLLDLSPSEQAAWLARQRQRERPPTPPPERGSSVTDQASDLAPWIERLRSLDEEALAELLASAPRFLRERFGTITGIEGVAAFLRDRELGTGGR